MSMKNEILVAGEVYSGEVLIVDFGYDNLKEDSWYVFCVDGVVREVIGEDLN